MKIRKSFTGLKRLVALTLALGVALCPLLWASAERSAFYEVTNAFFEESARELGLEYLKLLEAQDDSIPMIIFDTPGFSISVGDSTFFGGLLDLKPTQHLQLIYRCLSSFEEFELAAAKQGEELTCVFIFSPESEAGEYAYVNKDNHVEFCDMIRGLLLEKGVDPEAPLQK